MSVVDLELVRKNLALMALTILTEDEIEEAAFLALQSCLEMFGMDDICEKCKTCSGYWYLDEDDLAALEKVYGVTRPR